MTKTEILKNNAAPLTYKSSKDKIIRCAVYTRKSSEEGLDMEFNSLEAQREACEAYIKSQRQEGWALIDKRYDDGGCSGGTLERPALKELLFDIAQGLIDIIVVYKIDRLTRCLTDFSKIVEVLDKHETSFVSITQQFNTTTSMGRLTLNMLLSFAQFEREVTGERIRDKYAASKQKGMWMGGIAPLGYYRKDKKLYPDNDEVKKVNLIFERYIELRSVHLLKEYLDNNRVLSRVGKKFSKGILYHILCNRAYIGEVPHKDKWHKGQHEKIVPVETFNKAQEILKGNRIKGRSITVYKEPSLLAGKIFDDKGNYMSPSHSNKKGRRYRYYVSQAMIRHETQNIGEITKISAWEIESFATKVVREVFDNKEILQETLKDLPIKTQNAIIEKAREVNLTPQNIRDMISKVKIFKEKVEISYYAEQLKEVILSHYENRAVKEISKKTENTITKEIKIGVVDNGSKIIIGADMPNQTQNGAIMRLILKAYKWNRLLTTGAIRNAADIARQEKTHYSYVKKVLSLAYLSPRITESVVKGQCPRDLTITKIFSCKATEWAKQEQVLGFKSTITDLRP